LAFRGGAAGFLHDIRPLGGPYGNGPYRKAECAPNGRVVAALEELAAKLRELPEKEPGNWTINWQPFDDERGQAKSAAEKNDFVAAIRQYCHAIRSVMRQFREHRPTIDADGSAI
jgi:hypothetical protein